MKTSSPMPTDPRLDKVEAALRSITNISQKIIEGVARAIDEVVDPVRSARWNISDLDQPEKTVFGIRVENVLRMDLELERSSKLDLKIAGEDVDVKFTIRSNWSILILPLFSVLLKPPIMRTSCLAAGPLSSVARTSSG